MFTVGETIITRGCTYEVLAKGNEVDYQGQINLFVKIVRTEAPYKGRITYGNYLYFRFGGGLSIHV